MNTNTLMYKIFDWAIQKKAINTLFIFINDSTVCKTLISPNYNTIRIGAFLVFF